MEQLQSLAQQGSGSGADSASLDFNNSLAATYTKEELGKMEIYMLRFFNWSISYSTAVHFSDYFLTHGVRCDTESDGRVFGGAETTVEARDPILHRVQMEQYNTYFMEAALRGERERGREGVRCVCVCVCQRMQ